MIEAATKRFAAAVFNNWRNKVLKAENEFKRHVPNRINGEIRARKFA